MHDANLTYDYIIIGAGSAGCVLANRLTASGKHSVLLLEAGGNDNTMWIQMPLGYGKAVYDHRYTREFLTDPVPGLAERQLVWPRGVVLGGSSSINGLVYIRGQASDYDKWEAQGNPGWGWKDVLPYFVRSEHNTRGADGLHGSDGPQWVSDMGVRDALMEAIFDSAQQLGVPRNHDFNGPDQQGSGYYQFFIRQGRRCSAAVAYLRPALKRVNLQLEIGATVQKITMTGGAATGVTYVQNGKAIAAKAHREVLLSAGAIQSPQLLLLSGVGNQQDLNNLGIPVTCHLPGVGRNLQDHLNAKLVMRITKPITINDGLRTPIGKMSLGLNYLLFKKGALAYPASTAGLFTQVLPESSTPDIQCHFGALSADAVRYKPHPWSGATLQVCQLRPESRGTLTLRSANPADPPQIQPNYLDAESDRRCMVAGMKFLRRLIEQAPLRPYISLEYQPGHQIKSDADMLDYVRQTATTIFHPSGTCRMGSDESAVVDPALRVRGIKKLRVIDASIMPNLVSGNTNAPTIMIAEKASDMILAAAKGDDLPSHKLAIA